MRESILPINRRLGRVLQDFDLMNVNVLGEHRFFGASVLQDILLQDILLQGGPRVILLTGTCRERVEQVMVANVSASRSDPIEGRRQRVGWWHGDDQ